MCVVEETSGGEKNQSKVLYRIYTFHNSQLVIVTNTMKEEVRIDKNLSKQRRNLFSLSEIALRGFKKSFEGSIKKYFLVLKSEI